MRLRAKIKMYGSLFRIKQKNFWKKIESDTLKTYFKSG